MRLGIIDRGHGRRQRLALRVMRLVGRTEPDPVAKVCLYRPQLFGRPWLHFVAQLMRGESEWTAGEREVLATFVSQLNECPFCVGVHGGIAELREAGVTDPLGQWRMGRVDARLAATFDLLDKVTRTPEDVGPEDIARVRAAGVSDTAIVDALYISYTFNAINRVANAFDFGWETDERRRKLAKSLDQIAYHVPDVLLR
jgi:uncharacterized peroxidase-related enzyme